MFVSSAGKKNIAFIQQHDEGIAVNVDEDAVKELVSGALLHACGRLFGGFVIVLLILSLISGWGKPFDDTDGMERSGMDLHTDCQTGVQYLSRNGALTPRIDADGNVVINKEGC